MEQLLSLPSLHLLLKKTSIWRADCFFRVIISKLIALFTEAGNAADFCDSIPVKELKE